MSAQAAKSEIEIRSCATLAEYEECVRIEHLIWGEDMALPSPIFVVAHHTGGQVLGAFDGPNMIGFTLGLVGLHAGQSPGKPYLHSHMTAVLQAYRDRGVGRRLKLFQRQDALKRGIELVEWTFDPLELKNAYFNLEGLGAVVRRFIPDCYGVTESPLHAGLPTDRLVAEWWLDCERVKSILADDPLPLKNLAARIAVPTALDEIKAADRAAASRIQKETREQFEKWLTKGYVVTGVETRGTTTEYILEQGNAIAGLQLPSFAG